MDQERTRTLFRKLARLLGKASSDTRPENVHQLRTTVRRVESLLDFYFPGADDHRKLLKQLARIRRRAGRVRDVDVQLAALRTLRIGRDAAGKSRLQEALDRARAKHTRKLESELDAATVQAVRKRLRRAAEDIAEAPAPADPVAAALRAAARLARAKPPAGEDALHTYRMEGKHARYLAEMAGDVHEAVTLIAPLKRTQDALGDWHDWYTLSRTAAKVLDDAAPRPLAAAIENIARAKCAQAQRVMEDVRPDLVALHTAARRKRPAASQKSTSRTAVA